MKKFINKFAFILGASTILASCSGAFVEDSGGLDTVSSTITQGTWKVNTYIDNNIDLTSDFATYTFEFNRDGNVTATSNGVTTTGTWLENPYSNQVMLNFTNANATLSRINDQWNISSQNIKAVNFNTTTPEVLGITQQ
jgi:hypothetical protein